MPVDGAGLYSLLTSLGHPMAPSLSPEALDWVCETPECKEFVEWIANNLSRENVVTKGDLETFNLIPEDEVLSGQILTEALSSFGLADGQRMSEQELGREVNRLEVELGLMEECRDKLEEVADGLGAELSREQERIAQLDHLDSRAEVEERRSQEKMLILNTNYNQAMKELREAVLDLTNLYEAAKEDMDCPHFLSSINLGKLTEADAVLDKEIEALMTTYFSKSNMEGSEQQRGRDQSEFELLVGEISRLRVSLPRQELRRLKARAEEAGLIAVAEMLSEREGRQGGTDTVRQDIEDIKTLEGEALEILEQRAALQTQKLLHIDQKNKERRNGLVIKRLENIRDILLQQLAKREILGVLMDKEMKEVKLVEELYKEMIETLKNESTKFAQFREAMKSLGGRKSESEANVIPAEDLVMLRVHKVLYCNKHLTEVSHPPTYEQVFKALEKLREKSKTLDNQLRSKQATVTEEIVSSTEKTSHILSVLAVKDSNKQPSLQPSNIETGIKSVQKTMQEINEEIKKLNKDWKKDVEELKIKPELSILRNMWIDFIVRPKSLIAAMKNLEMKAQHGKK